MTTSRAEAIHLIAEREAQHYLDWVHGRRDDPPEWWDDEEESQPAGVGLEVAANGE